MSNTDTSTTKKKNKSKKKASKNGQTTSTTADTATIAFRIVDFVDSPTSTVGDAFTDLLIKFNAGIHSYDNATGI